MGVGMFRRHRGGDAPTDLRSQDMSVKELRDHVKGIYSISMLRAIAQGEEQHPDYPGGRESALEAIRRQSDALRDGRVEMEPMPEGYTVGTQQEDTLLRLLVVHDGEPVATVLTHSDARKAAANHAAQGEEPEQEDEAEGEEE